MHRTYLDYNATTPLAPEALRAMLPLLDANFGNPSSIHFAGREARAALDSTRELFAHLIGAKSAEVVFTGGGTESDNHALFGAARAMADKGRHIITSGIEHHAVLHACQQLQQREGFELTVLPVGSDGILDPESVRAAIRNDTVLVSVMWANNETGTLQPIREIGLHCRNRGVIFHTDAIQAFGKVPLNVSELPVDLLSLSAHKVYGPKGVGALWIRPRLKIDSLLVGGSQENDRRAGTENIAGIVGFERAAELSVTKLESEALRLRGLTEKLWSGLKQRIDGVVRNGHPERRVANTLNVSFPGCKSDALLMSLDLEGIGASSGSACAVGSLKPSHVLTAMGLPPAVAGSAVRFSLGANNTEADVARVLEVMPRIVERLRSFQGTSRYSPNPSVPLGPADKPL